MSPSAKLHVAVIGGGMAGLVAGRHLADPASGFSFVIFEQSGSLGGTWVYSDAVGTDSHGIPIHSSMYKSLRTNLPKEAMMFPDFPHTKQGVSYLSYRDILQYLNDYADHFKLRPHVKFHHHVRKVRPVGKHWEIQVTDLNSNINRTFLFDAVMICNGHNSKPKYPCIKGIGNFTGRQMHSHDYREPEPFKGKQVLIIGAGPSGLDMAFEISSVAESVILSHHTCYAAKVGFPQKVILKPDLEEVLENGNILFTDGTIAQVNVILYCTGYSFNFQFLSDECGLRIKESYIDPLYKHIININNPSMAVVGINKHTPIFYVADIQVRFFLQTLKHPEGLPAKEDMMKELSEEVSKKKENGIKESDYHLLGQDNSDYIQQLSHLGGFSPMPSILLRIYFHGYDKIFSDFKNFRYNYYNILDENNFTVIDLREIQNKPIQYINTKLPQSLVTGKKS